MSAAKRSRSTSKRLQHEAESSTLRKSPDSPECDGAAQSAGLRAQTVVIGVVEPYDGDTRGVNGDITKTVHFAGTHSINVGYTWDFSRYNDRQFWSGDRFVVPSLNAIGTAPGKQAFTDFVSGKTTDINFILQLVSSLKGLTANCDLCPYDNVPGVGYEQVTLQQNRGRFDGGVTISSGKYHAAYINNAWQMGKYVTLNAGVRWEQRLIGNISEHTFSNMWSPRVGITVDPTGNRKQKIYANFGRYAYVLPLDAAIRALSNEDDLRGLYFAPASTPCPAGTNDANGADISGKSCATINALGTVEFVGDQAHFINTPTCATAPCGITKNANFLSSGLLNEPFATGSRMEFTDEFLVGYDREFKGGVVASVRYIDRRLKRVIEDQSGSSVEQNNAGLPLFYVIGNPNAQAGHLRQPE